jgi:uncharacterized protein YjbJ (UPF0337 family)
MADMYFDVDAALTEVPVNLLSLIDDTDFKTRETAVAYNAAGMDLVWNFVTSAGVFTQTAVTPTTAGNYDWTHQGDGMYTIEIPASGGASINNDTEGYGWFTGLVTGVLPWRGPVIGFRSAALNDSLCDTNTTGLLAPTVAARTLDVSAGGEAGIDWANVGSPTTAVNLSATNIDVDQVVASVSGAVGSVTGAVGSVTGAVGSVTGAVGSVTGNVGGNVVGTVASVVGAVGSVTGNVGGNVTGSVGSVTGLTNATIADAVWDEDATAHQTQGTFGQAIGDPGADTDTIFGLVNTNLDAAVSTRLSSAGYTAPDNASISAILTDTAEIGAAGAGLTALASAANLATVAGYIDTEIATLQTSVNDLPTNAELATALDALPTAAENATAVLTTAMTESYRADGATGTLAQMQYEIIGHLGESAIVGTTKTINKVDGTTAAATFTLDSDTAPTSITRAT